MAALCQRQAFAGAFGQTAIQRPQVQRARLQVCASFKNKENINLAKVDGFKHHGSDSGSTEVQIARLTARVEQISMHMRVNKKDASSQRGLQAVLNQRKKLMLYLYKTNRSAYDKLMAELGIRSVVGKTQ